jgi:hypothetical protein
MHCPSLGTQLLLLPLLSFGSVTALAPPVGAAQQVLAPVEAASSPSRKLQGRFLHITGMQDSSIHESTMTSRARQGMSVYVYSLRVSLRRAIVIGCYPAHAVPGTDQALLRLFLTPGGVWRLQWQPFSGWPYAHLARVFCRCMEVAGRHPARMRCGCFLLL